MSKQFTKLRPASLVLSFAGLLFAYQAHAEESSMSGIQKSQSAGASSQGSTVAVMKLTTEDEKMMHDLARASMTEINEGKLAEKKSENEQVKSFAKK